MFRFPQWSIFCKLNEIWCVQMRIQDKKVQLYKINNYLGKKIIPVASHFHAGSNFSLAWLDPNSAYKKKSQEIPRIACSYLLAISDDLKNQLKKIVADLFSLVPNLLACRSDPKSLQIFFLACSIFLACKICSPRKIIPRCKSFSRLFHLLACKTCLIPNHLIK